MNIRVRKAAIRLILAQIEQELELDTSEPDTAKVSFRGEPIGVVRKYERFQQFIPCRLNRTPGTTVRPD